MALNVSLFVSGSTLFVSGNLASGANMRIDIPLSVLSITSSVIVVSSSVIFQSGSTKWGDTNDDVHSFTGSIRVNGSISGTLTGTVFGSINGTEGLTGSLQRLISGQSYLAPGPHITITTASSGQVIIAGEGVADVSSSYLVVGLTGSLPNERALAAGPGIAFNDGGPGGSFTISSVVRESADVSGSYVTLGNTGSLPNERSLSASFGLLLTDNGAGSTVALSVNNNEIATLSGSTFRGTLYASGGLTGSLQLVAPGTSYLAAGPHISLVTQSNGQVTISGEGVADVSASYVTIGNTGSLPNERQLSASFGLLLSDGGAGSTVSFRVNDNDVATLSGSTFRGSLYASGGLTGSHFQAAPGVPALSAGTGVQLLSQTNGSVLITAVTGVLTGAGGFTVPNNVKYIIVSGALAAVNIQLSDHPNLWQEHLFKCGDGLCSTWPIGITASLGMRIDDAALTAITSSYAVRGLVFVGNNLWSVFSAKV